jgi:hypothetical protein
MSKLTHTRRRFSVLIVILGLIGSLAGAPPDELRPEVIALIEDAAVFFAGSGPDVNAEVISWRARASKTPRASEELYRIIEKESKSAEGDAVQLQKALGALGALDDFDEQKIEVLLERMKDLDVSEVVAPVELGFVRGCLKIIEFQELRDYEGIALNWLQSFDGSVRACAATALGKIGGAESLAVLETTRAEGLRDRRMGIRDVEYRELTRAVMAIRAREESISTKAAAPPPLVIENDTSGVKETTERHSSTSKVMGRPAVLWILLLLLAVGVMVLVAWLRWDQGST